MPDRIDGGTIFAAAGGALLLVSLFLHWYFIPGTPPAIADAPLNNAWGTFETLDIVLAAIAVGTVYMALAGLPMGSTWMLPLGAIAFVIVVSQILDPPPNVAATVAAGAKGPDPAIGAWLALAGSAGLLVAGVLSRASVSFAVDFDTGGRTARTRERSATS